MDDLCTLPGPGVRQWHGALLTSTLKRACDLTGAAATLERICAVTRAVNSAVGQRLVAIGELDTIRTGERVADDRWAVDTFDGVAAELSGALAGGDMPASLLLPDARALRDRLPGVGALLVAGLITDWAFSVRSCSAPN